MIQMRIGTWSSILFVVTLINLALPDLAHTKPRDTEICLSHQFIVPKNWDNLTWNERRKLKAKYRNAAEDMVANANRLLKANKVGVKIELKGDMPNLDRDPKKLKKQKAEFADEHCMELYFDADRGGGSGQTDGERFSVQNLSPVPSGIDLDYQKVVSMGESITMGVSFDQTNGADSNGTTLAHELGHAFGLGMGPTPEDHREIEEYDNKIEHSLNANERMMRHLNPGDKLTDKEKELMKAMAAHWRKTTGQCSTAYHIIEDEVFVSDKPFADVIYTSITSTTQFLRFDAHLAAEAPLATQILISLDLDTARDGQSDRQLSFFFGGNEWQYEHVPPALSAEHEPHATRLISTSGQSMSVSRVIAWVPRNYLPRNFGEVGWRMEVSIAGTRLREKTRSDKFDYLDITPPDYEVALSSEFKKIEVRAGDTVMLSGSIKPNHQLSGVLEVASQIEDELFNEDSIIESYVDPEAGVWEAQLHINEEAKPGTYPLKIDVFCSMCKLSKTLHSTVTVTDGGPPKSLKQ